MKPEDPEVSVIVKESTETPAKPARRVRLFGVEAHPALWTAILLGIMVGVGLAAGLGLGLSPSSSSSDTTHGVSPSSPVLSSPAAPPPSPSSPVLSSPAAPPPSSSSPVLSSPAAPPPSQPLLPSVSGVSFSIQVAGDLSSYTADVIGELEAAVATRASVAPAAVAAQVIAGSVIVGFTIGSSSSGEARTISSTISAALASSPSTIFSSVTGVAVAVEAVLLQPTVSSFSTKSGSVSVSVSAGIAGRTIPEPYKPTRLCAFSDCTLVGGESFTWNIAYMPWADELNTPNVATITYATGEASWLVHEFTRPGYYNVSVTSQTHGAANLTLNNVYARREVRDLTSKEWGLYVDALWTLMNVSTADGRQRFTCPSGRQEDYHTHAFFVALHGTASANTTCDQLHFSLMQEFAHLGWNTLLEKSMQCVHPSVALTYWNEAYDRRVYYDESLGPKSLLRSPVWNTTYLGSAANHDNDDTGANPQYFVKDGAFAYWPLRQNRTGVCDELAELFADLKTHCEVWVASDKMGWFGPKETAGFWYQEPRPLEAFQYISRRPGYLLGSAARGLSNFPTDSDVLQGSQKPTLSKAMETTRGDQIHGRMHYWVSGVWQPTSPMSDATVASAVWSARTWTTFAWTFEDRVRMDGCYTCDATKCECAVDSEARGCWDMSVETPLDTFDVQGSLALSNNWRDHVSSRRIGSAWRKNQSGCDVGVTGTFQRSPTANQDPAFYLHHSFTFMVNELAMRYQRDNSLSSGPLFGLDKDARGVAECAGNNYGDVTIFAHLVPYTTGQTVGARHTWDHILRMWDFPRRHFRWVVEGEL